MKKLLLITTTVFFIQTSNAQSIDYFGQTPPGDEAVIFAPGIISIPDRAEGPIVFSPDGKECYFSVYDTARWGILFTKYINNSWTEQEKAPFSINKYALAPFFSKDGNRLYFDYYIQTSQNLSIWMVERQTGKWGEPQKLPSPINLGTYSGYYSETADGVAYINSERSGGFGSDDIWCIHPLSNQAENLGSKVNASGQDSYPCVAHDGSFLIFSSTRSGKIGYQDLYICFDKGNDEWTVPVNMEINGAGINVSSQHQAYPSLSPDGRFLFFTRHTASGDIEDIYWISTSIIDTLKKIAMPTTLVNQVIDKKVMLYPNPTNGHITLSLGTSQSRESFVEISNIQGKLVFTKTFQNTSSATIDLTGNSAGIYIVKVIAGESYYEEKICLE